MDTRNISCTAAAPTQPSSYADLLRDLVRLLGGPEGGVDPAARTPLLFRRLTEDAVLAHEGAPLRSLYVVRSGSLKCVRTLGDGYEQVTALALPGDVLGFDGLHRGHHATTDIALEHATVYALPVSTLHDLRRRYPALDRAWHEALSRQLASASATADMLAAVTAEVRLARFVLWLAARSRELGWSPRRLRLSLCRRDLASLLGMAHETLSRSFSTLAQAGLLTVDNRELELLDVDEIQVRARTTRRPEPGTAAQPRDTHPGMPAARPPATWSSQLQFPAAV